MAHQKAHQGHNTQITSILQTSVLKHPSKVTTLKLLQVSKLECFKTAHQRSHQGYNTQITPSL